MLDPSLDGKRAEKLEVARENYRSTFGSFDMHASYDSLFELLWYSQLPCFDVANITSTAKDQLGMIKQCVWKGREVSCSAVFEMRPTDRGMCCSFNTERADQVYRKSRYADILKVLQVDFQAFCHNPKNLRYTCRMVCVHFPKTQAK